MCREPWVESSDTITLFANRDNRLCCLTCDEHTANDPQPTPTPTLVSHVIYATPGVLCVVCFACAACEQPANAQLRSNKTACDSPTCIKCLCAQCGLHIYNKSVFRTTLCILYYNIIEHLSPAMIVSTGSKIGGENWLSNVFRSQNGLENGADRRC